MIFAYIAVAMVAGFLIGFVTLSVIWTVRNVGKNIRSRSATMLSTYDRLLEQRSRYLGAIEMDIDHAREELEKLSRPQDAIAEAAKEQPEVGQSPSALLKAAEKISTTPYRSDGTGDAYRRIREQFNFDPLSAVEAIAKPVQRGGAAERVLEELPFDTVYQLSTLPGAEQRELLETVLPEEAKPLLEEYAAGHSRFDCLEFYDGLKARAAEESTRVSLRIAANAAEGMFPLGADVIVDEDICEGFQVEADGVLYDYCIKAREIG